MKPVEVDWDVTEANLDGYYAVVGRFASTNTRTCHSRNWSRLLKERIVAKKLFWVSWQQPTADYRPLSFPPNEAILGWWCSGSGGTDEDSYHHICAYVAAENEDAVYDAVRIDWPEAGNWRFCEERDKLGESDRFPPSDWMKERMKAFEESN